LYSAANQDITDTRYALAAAYIISGQPERALNLLRADEPADRFEPAILRGEIARRAGDLATARSFFNAREVNVAGDRALRWAWDHLSPPDVDEIDLGSGLDVGYVRGFYGAERDANGKPFRWSGEHAEVRGLTRVQLLQIEWSGWRPAALSPAKPGILTSDMMRRYVFDPEVTQLQNDSSWVVKAIETGGSSETNFKLEVSSFIGAGNDPRLLGVRVSRVVVSK
jgi:hypothetical protein